ncbi:hypothetical protein FHU39_000335 [Flexivirga oryzae]|uniref:Uncharacterized protein n=1 Tax=Flexivirga oryzae TaxID=1794944 RepID=A0A839N6H0_9MICO|nr:hypothetical protein [Flexivirga oryzae]
MADSGPAGRNVPGPRLDHSRGPFRRMHRSCDTCAARNTLVNNDFHTIIGCARRQPSSGLASLRAASGLARSRQGRLPNRHEQVSGRKADARETTTEAGGGSGEPASRAVQRPREESSKKAQSRRSMDSCSARRASSCSSVMMWSFRCSAGPAEVPQESGAGHGTECVDVASDQRSAGSPRRGADLELAAAADKDEAPRHVSQGTPGCPTCDIPISIFGLPTIGRARDRSMA